MLMKRRLWIAIVVLLADQLSKAAARKLAASIPLIPGVLGLCLCRNTGMAFSMLSGMPWLLGILSLVLIGAGWLILRRYRLTGIAAAASMLMLGGALGNAIDRLLMGYVTDMIEILCFQFAVFNIADAALTVGCVLMAVSLIFLPAEWQPSGGDRHGA